MGRAHVAAGKESRAPGAGHPPPPPCSPLAGQLRNSRGRGQEEQRSGLHVADRRGGHSPQGALRLPCPTSREGSAEPAPAAGSVAAPPHPLLTTCLCVNMDLPWWDTKYSIHEKERAAAPCGLPGSSRGHPLQGRLSWREQVAAFVPWNFISP